MLIGAFGTFCITDRYIASANLLWLIQDADTDMLVFQLSQYSGKRLMGWLEKR
jgi:hypothetical protein